MYVFLTSHTYCKVVIIKVKLLRETFSFLTLDLRPPLVTAQNIWYYHIPFCHLHSWYNLSLQPHLLLWSHFSNHACNFKSLENSNVFPNVFIVKVSTYKKFIKCKKVMPRKVLAYYKIILPTFPSNISALSAGIFFDKFA